MKTCALDMTVTSMLRLVNACRPTVWNEQRRIFSTSASVDTDRPTKRGFASWYGNGPLQSEQQFGKKDLPEVLAVLKAKYLHNLKASKGGVDLQRTSKSSKNDPHQGSFYTMFWHFYDMFEDKTSFATLYVVYVVAITFFTLTLINFATPERAENALAPKSQATENYLDWDKNEHLRQELKAKQKELYKMLRTKDTVDMKVEKLQKEVQLLKQQKTW